MHVTELNRDQIIELKQNYLCQLDDEGTLMDIVEIKSVSYDTLAFADEIIPDDIIFEHYDGVCFVDDDFFCSCIS